jgi:hypothetical protein
MERERWGADAWAKRLKIRKKRASQRFMVFVQRLLKERRKAAQYKSSAPVQLAALSALSVRNDFAKEWLE